MSISRRKLIIAVYFGATHSHIAPYIEHLANILLFMFLNHDVFFVTGDFNIDSNNNSFRKCFHFYYFMSMVNEPTRISKYTETLINSFFAINSIIFIVKTLKQILQVIIG